MSEIETAELWYDDDPLAVIEKINSLLQPYNLSIDMDDEEHDGFVVIGIIKTEED